MNHNENKPNDDSSLNQDIERLETTLNHLTEELRKLKERKQALEVKEKASNSTSGKKFATNNKRKEFVAVEYENSGEPTSHKKKLDENSHEIAVNGEQTLNNIEYNIEETKDKRFRTISISEVSVEDGETRKSKRKKWKHKNKIDEDGNTENSDVNENMSIFENGAIRKQKKKGRKISNEYTNLETSSNLKSLNNSLNDEVTIKPLQKTNNIDFEKMDIKERLETIKKLVNSITEHTFKNEDKKQENHNNSEHSSNEDKKQENHNNSELPSNSTSENPNKLETNHNPQSNFHTNYIRYNDKFHYNRFPSQRSPPLNFQNNSSPKNSSYRSPINQSPNKSHVQNNHFFNNAQRQTLCREDKRQLRDNLKSKAVKLKFKGANISDIPGYGQMVWKL